jgi:hypothetical protein
MERRHWLDATFLAAGITFICFLVAESVRVLLLT